MDFLSALRKSKTADAPLAPAAQSAALVADARRACERGDDAEALAACDRAIAADPHNDEPWLLKAEYLGDPVESLGCLQAGLMVNPGSDRLRQAVERMNGGARAAR